MNIVATEPAGFEIDVKRLYLPFRIEDECPACKKAKVFDLNDQYFMRNQANQDFTHPMYCGDCDHEWSVRLHLEVSLRKATT